MKIGKRPGTDKKLEPEDIYLDYWLWRRWTQEVVSKLPEITQSRLSQTAKKYVARYIQFGDSLPNPSMAEATDKAENRIFKKLNRFRLVGEGENPLPLEKGKRTVDGLLEIFSDIVKKKEDNALMRGLKKAYEVVFPTKVLDIETPEEIEHEIKKGVQGGMSSAFTKAWKTVFGILVPGQESKEETPEAIQKEVRIAISRRITRGVNATLKALGAQGKREDVPEEGTEFSDLPDERDELDENVELAAGAFQQRANCSALEFALAEIKGTKIPDNGSLGIEELQAELDKEIKPFRDGLENATRNLIKGVIGDAAAKSSSDPLVAVKKRIQDLNKVEQLTHTLMIDLRKDPHKLDLSSAGQRAFSQLVDFVENLPKPAEKPLAQIPSIEIADDDLGKGNPPP